MKRRGEVKHIMWDGKTLRLLDQRKLPLEEVWIECRTHEDVAEAIEAMVVRGAPAIGVVAAYGVAIGAKVALNTSNSFIDFKSKLEAIISRLSQTRPTAVNLFWSLKRMKEIVDAGTTEGDIVKALETEAINIEKQDIETNRKIGYFGAELLTSRENILTHCNTGTLATAGFGTALGVVRAAFEMGKDVTVYVDETRPYLQGARLTAWELEKEGIRYYLITDNMAGWLMALGEISCVIVGADRIAMNGDTANKIGTYTLSVLAREHGIPFYVAAPSTTFDFSISSGEEIPIEERSQDEVLYCHCKDCRIAPKGARVRNPSFDITPGENITAIITEKGVIDSPDENKIKEFFGL